MFTNRNALTSVLKEGGRSYTGVEETTLRNIGACKQLTTVTQTSIGPQSMKKLVVNHLGKIFVTSDASTILQELDIAHPAAKLLVMAAQMQRDEFGDGVSFLLLFAGELLLQAESLIKLGIHPSDIIVGYEKSLEKCLTQLKDYICWSITDFKNVDQLQKAICTSLMSKHSNSPMSLAKLIAQAAVSIMPDDPKDFDIECVRVTKLLGGTIHQSHTLNGIVVTHETHGAILSKKNVKVMVLGCGLDMTGTETKGTVLIHNASELLNFTKSEEQLMEKTIKQIKQAGVEALIVNGPISSIAQHYCDQNSILTLKITSKFEIRRICKALGATSLVRLGAPLPEELGHADSIDVQEIASKMVTVIRARDSLIATIILRGGTNNAMDETERAIDDALNVLKAATKNSDFLPGGGCCDALLAHEIQKYSASIPGLDQYSVMKFGQALEAVPRILSESAGLDSTEAITKLYAAHRQGNVMAGINCEGTNILCDVQAAGILDHYAIKDWAIRLATDAAISVLRINQIIMAKPAGGPKPRAPGPPDMD